MVKHLKSNSMALIGISIASFLGCLDLTIVNTALPAIQIAFNAPITQLQWVMNILLIALTTFMVLAGKLEDNYGRRRLLYIGMLFFGLSSLGAGLSPTINWLILFRFIQGLSIAILYTAPIAVIPSLFPQQQQGKAIGLVVGANGFGLALGPCIGGLMLSIATWHWIFLINLPIIFISFMLCRNSLPESKSTEENKRIDWLGFALLIIGLPAFILATVEGETWGWLSVPTLGLYVTAVVSLLVFYLVEKRVKMPIIQFELFANRTFLIGLSVSSLLAFFYAIDFFLMPLYLHFIHGQTGLQIGLTLLPATVLVAIFSPLAGRIVDSKGPKEVLLSGCLFLTISAALQMQLNQNSSIYFILVAYIIFGLGWACILSPSIIAAMATVPAEKGGVAMGTLGTTHNFGGVIGLALGTVVYRVFAQRELLSTASQQNLPIGDWMARAVVEIENAVQIIKDLAKLDFSAANHLFQLFFLSGYRSAMVLLLMVSIIALLLVGLGLKSTLSRK